MKIFVDIYTSLCVAKNPSFIILKKIVQLQAKNNPNTVCEAESHLNSSIKHQPTYFPHSLLNCQKQGFILIETQ